MIQVAVAQQLVWLECGRWSMGHPSEHFGQNKLMSSLIRALGDAVLNEAQEKGFLNRTTVG